MPRARMPKMYEEQPNPETIGEEIALNREIVADLEKELAKNDKLLVAANALENRKARLAKKRLEEKFDMWRECEMENNPEYTVDDEISFLKENSTFEIAKKVFDEMYQQENGWILTDDWDYEDVTYED